MTMPRRIDIERLTPAETAIRNAMIAVEEMPADSLLTEAVNLLQHARDKVADYVDREPRAAVVTVPAGVAPCVPYRATRIANTVQTITGCSDGIARILARELTDFAEEIKRQAVEP
jgi:hypothetical protein